jgi:hypothetical protein
MALKRQQPIEELTYSSKKQKSDKKYANPQISVQYTSIGCYVNCAKIGTIGLALSDHKTQKDDKKDNRQFLLGIKIQIQKELSLDTDLLHIEDETGKHIANFYRSKVQSHMDIRVLVDEEMMGRELIFFFQQEKFRYANFFSSRALSFSTFLISKINIPSLTIKGEKDICSVCFETVESEKRFIPNCGHLFCISCIFEYLRVRNLLSVCSCELHSNITAIIKCPVCRNEINESVKAR